MSRISTRSALVLAVMGIVAAADSPPAAPTGSVRIEIARKVGYVIGDLVPYVTLVTVDRSWTLRESSLPSPGRPEYWLELRQVDVSHSDSSRTRVYRIHLVYQTFYAPLEARVRSMPGFTLSFQHAGATSDIAVPPLPVTMSPLREVATGTGDPEENVALEPDRPPPDVSLHAPTTGIALALALSLLAGLLLAWQQARWPFRGHLDRPFTQSERELRARGIGDAEKYAAGLLSIHRGFDGAAGWRVFAEDQNRFLGQFPRYGDLQAEIARFFEASRYCFFGGDGARAAAVLPPDALRQLARRLSALERGV
jgi:mxaA protein